MKLEADIEGDLSPPPRIDRRLGHRRRKRAAPSLSNEDLARALSHSPALSSMSEEDRRAIVALCDARSTGMGRVILRQGDRGNGLYLLAEGRVRVIDESDPSHPLTLVTLEPGAVFGERSLLLDAPVGATVRAAGAVRVLTLSPDAFRATVQKRPQLARRMTEAIGRYERYNLLRRIGVFRDLAEADVYALVDAADTVELAAGDPLTEVGVGDDGVCAVSDGTLRAEARADPEEAARPPAEPGLRPAGLYRSGDLHGLRRLFDPAARPLQLTAHTSATLFRWSADTFLDITGRSAETLAALDRAAARETQRLATLLAPGEGPVQPDAGRRANARSGPASVALKGRRLLLWPGTAPADDGMACLRTAAAFLGHGERLADAAAAEDRIEPALSLLALRAESAGFVSRNLHIPFRDLAVSMVPFLFQGPDGRLKVALALDRDMMTYADPAEGGLTTVLRRDAEGWWRGRALTVAAVPDFGGVGAGRVGMITRFLPMLRPHRRALVQLFLLALLGLLVGLLLPLATQVIIDHVLVFSDRNLLVLMLTAIVFAALMSMASNAASSFLMLRTANMINGLLMARFFSHVLSVPLERLRKWRAGDLAVRFEENESVFGLATGILGSAIFDLLSLVVFGAVLFTVAPDLAAVAVGISLLVCVIIVAASKRLRAYEVQTFNASRDLQSHVIETFDGIESLKFASREEATTRLGISLLDRSIRIGVASDRFSFRLGLAISALSTFTTLAVLGIGGMMVLDGTMSAGMLVAFSGLLAGMTGPLERLAGVHDEVQELRVAFERVNDILDLPRESGGDAAAPALTGRIRLENVSFEYEPGAPVLQEIDLEIEPGTKVAFVGPSGSGKSTLARMLNRLLEPTSGRVLIDGLDIARVEPASLRRQIGVVEQVPHIFSGTIRENIAKAFPEMPLERVVTAARLTGAADFVERLPMTYSTRVGEGGRSLSGGQAQRIAIARAIAGDPAILILDEATSALDTESERAVQRALDGAMRARTVIAIAHRLATIRNADRIVVLDRGRIVETGTHDSLMALGGTYRSLVEAGDSATEDT